MPSNNNSAASSTKAKSKFDERNFADLLPALQRLDSLLAQAITAVPSQNGAASSLDPFRGLYISREEVEHLLVRTPGEPTLWVNETAADDSWLDSLADSSRLAWLQQAFELTSFEVDVILIALAPELDRRYEQLYAYLQDHVSRRMPTVDLVLNLLCPDAASKLERRVHFDANASLIYHDLIYLMSDPSQTHSSLLAQAIKLDDQIVRFLLYQDGLDTRLASFCRLAVSPISLEEIPIATEVRQALPTIIHQAWKKHQPLRLYFYGPNGAGKRQTAVALAEKFGRPLLVVNLRQALKMDADFAHTLRLVFRYSWFYGPIPYFDDIGALQDNGTSSSYQQLLDTLAIDTGITIMAGKSAWVPSGRNVLGVTPVPFAIPDFVNRRAFWQTSLAASGITLRDSQLDALTGRFRLLPAQITEAIETARNHAHWRIAAQPNEDLPPLDFVAPTLVDLFSAARVHSGHDLAALTHKIDPIYTWNDIVLPEDTLAQLHEICRRVAHRHHVFDEWGFSLKLSKGRGVNALFSGSSGTGKTMAAEIIANELGLDLYKIDLSGVVSKYIGETEKNLNRIFNAAENANAILLFDEADALFGKRSDVSDAHDRYANIEVSYLLQKMEEYEGVAILSTNLRQNLDNAFIRRLAFIIHFPFPDAESRQQIWENIWPAAAPVDEELDFSSLAEQFKLSGGNIKNVVLAAAFLAATDETAVGLHHIHNAIRREHQKMGKVQAIK